MPFDPDAYLAQKQQPQGFDPDAYLASKQPEQDQSQSLGQKALGLIGKAANAVDSVTGAPMRAAIGAAQNTDNPFSLQEVGEAAKAFGHQFARDPSEAPTGEQIVQKAGVPQGIPSKVAGVGMDLAANPLNFAGGALKLAGKGAKALEGTADTLQSFAHEKALKAAGAMTKDFNMIKDKGMQDALGSFLLDTKTVTPLSTVSKVAERLETAKKTAGQTIGHILDTSDAANAPRISAQQIALDLAQDPDIVSLAKVPGKEGTATQIENYLQTLHKNGDSLTLREAQKLRQGIDDSINFNKRVPEMAGAQPYLYKMRDAISEKMNDAVNALPNGGDLDRLKEANAAYSKLSTLDKIAENRLGALSSNRTVGLTDTIAGAMGAASGHTPMEAAVRGAVGALGNKAVRTLGAPIMATGSNNAAKIIRSAPGLISQVPEASGPALGAAAETGKEIQGLLGPERMLAGEKKKK